MLEADPRFRAVRYTLLYHTKLVSHDQTPLSQRLLLNFYTQVKAPHKIHSMKCISTHFGCMLILKIGTGAYYLNLWYVIYLKAEVTPGGESAIFATTCIFKCLQCGFSTTA